jgi:hypothetical protein
MATRGSDIYGSNLDLEFTIRKLAILLAIDFQQPLPFSYISFFALEKQKNIPTKSL